MIKSFLTFADGSETYRGAAQRLALQAQETGWFDTVHALHCDNLRQLSEPWFEQHQKFLLSHSRGFGYWFWKPFLVYEMLRRLADGSILVYADAGFEISAYGQKRFDDYVEMALQHELLATHIHLPVKNWTKGDLIDYFSVRDNPSIVNANQVAGGLIVVKKNDLTLNFFRYWSLVAADQNYHLIDDSPSVSANLDGFVEHRHDQAIFTLLLKTMNFGHSISYLHETVHPELFAAGQFNRAFPFVCLRNRTGQRQIQP